MNKFVKYILASSIAFLGLNASKAQQQAPIDPSEVAGHRGNRIVTTAVPFLSISPNARAAGMGDVGVATLPDANSTHFNPAKLAFINSDLGFSLSYTPWLKKIVPDMSVSYLSAYKKLTKEQAVGLSLRYFDMGNIQFTDDQGQNLEVYMPREFAIDGTYSRQLSEKLGIGVTARFIYSSLSNDISAANITTRNGMSAAADIGAYYNTPFTFAGTQSELALGMAITNIGSKIAYTSSNARDFIPTMLKLGAAYTAHIDQFNKVSVAMDVNKLMVPTPPVIENDTIVAGRSMDRSLLSGMFGSFSDAPGGFSEEMQEVMLSAGVEYWYNDLFAARAGYFWEHENKGNRKYISLGIGMRYQVFGLDMAYLVPQSQDHPLAETLRFSLTFDLDSYKADNKSVKQ